MRLVLLILCICTSNIFPEVGTLLMTDNVTQWSKGKLFLYDIKTGATDTLVREGVYGPCFSPDGKKVAFTASGKRPIQIMDLFTRQIDSIGAPIDNFTLTWANDGCIYFRYVWGKTLLKINVETGVVDTVYKLKMTYNSLASDTQTAGFFTGNVSADGARGAYVIDNDQLGNRTVSFDFATNFELMINNADGDRRLSCQATMSPNGLYVGTTNYAHKLVLIKPYNSNGAAYRTAYGEGIWMIRFAYNSSDELVYRVSSDSGTYFYRLSSGSSERILKGPCAWGLDSRGWVLDTVAPSAPSGLISEATENFIKLTWTAPSSGSRLPNGYIIERNGERIGTVSGTTFTDKNLTASTTYGYSVYGRTDGVGLSVPLTGSFSTTADQRAPELVASYSFGTTVDLLFSEPLNPASVTTVSNYTFMPSVAVSSVVLTAPTRVRLTTSSTNDISNAIINVSGVSDLATVPNTSTLTSDTVSIVSNLWTSTGRVCKWATVDSGALYWTDDTPPEARMVSKSPIYGDLPYFQTSWRDGVVDSLSDYLKFNISRRTEVLVAFGNGVSTWAKNTLEWTNTGTDIGGWFVYSKIFEPGQVVLKGCGLGNYKTYIVVLRNTDSLPNVASEKTALMPVIASSLAFAPSPVQSVANISYQIPKQGNVKLAIFNTQGRLLEILTNKEHVVGSYHTTWKGPDANNRRLPNGVYFCSLLMEKNVVHTKKFVIMR
jgi:hypothetical protein